MLEHGTPPRNATVRLAQVTYNSTETAGPPFLPAGWAATRPYEICSIVAIPGIVCETLIAPPDHLAAFINATEYDYRFVRVWPQQVASAGTWTPRIPLSPFDLLALRDAWDHTPDAVGGNFPEIILPWPHRHI